MKGDDIVLTGSITLLRAAQANDLVDEYRLFVYPVVIGAGRQLFEDHSRRADLRLLDAHPFRSGVVLLRYATK
jgi:dihydrofolate reductase